MVPEKVSWSHKPNQAKYICRESMSTIGHLAAIIPINYRKFCCWFGNCGNNGVFLGNVRCFSEISAGTYFRKTVMELVL